jgi:hypothetical protein
MVTATNKHKFSTNLTWYTAVAMTLNGPSAHYDLGAGGHGITTDCHDAFAAAGGLASNPHCFTGTVLGGVSTGVQWRFLCPSSTVRFRAAVLGRRRLRRSYRDWSAKWEWLFAKFQDRGFVTALGDGTRSSVTLDNNILRFGINYRFGGGPAVVAKY